MNRRALGQSTQAVRGVGGGREHRLQPMLRRGLQEDQKKKNERGGHLVRLTEVNKSNAPSACYSPTPSQVTSQNEGPN